MERSCSLEYLEEIKMKLTTKINYLGLTIIMVGFATCAMADINVVGYGNTFIQSPVFGDAINPSGNMLNFDYDQTGDQSSLGTCTMNPMSSNFVEGIIEELPLEEPETFVAIQDYDYAAPRENSSVNNSPDRPRYRDDNSPPPPPEDNPSVPEPATFLIMGLGAVGMAPLVRKWRRK